ncbi:hypothetical protein FHS96_000664 [Sphingomonas zeicaulis]|uniref:hypothetical protein n=1 Tax=Sphingomonas zeicaulis TaxID=1632740 RepID=UPI003D1F8D3B
MLFHVSIEADEPRRVAGVLAEVMGGIATPFPPVIDGSWVAHAGDDRNTLVEVYPRGTELHRADGGVMGLPAHRSRHNPTHFALATALDEDAVKALAAREGWHAETFSRDGLFHVIELWIEGSQMIELLTPEFQAEYLESLSIDRWRAMLSGHPAMAEAA